MQMPRPLRENVEGGIYHVFARGNNRSVIYRDDVDRSIYLGRLEKLSTKRNLRCLAYCLMDNHVHLLLETPRANLSSAMQILHGGYGLGFNARHSRSGHLFQGRYGAVRMRRDPQLLAVAGYIARNPVEAQLCDRPEDWRWSSYALVMRRRTPAWLEVARLLEFFGDGGESALQRYAESVWSFSRATLDCEPQT